MPKTGKSTGPSLPDGTRPQPLEQRAGDVELSGPYSDLTVGGNLAVGGNIVVTGTGQTISNTITRDWAVDGWSKVTPVTITSDPGQVFTTTAANGRGTVTSAASAAGNHRVAYLFDNTTCTDSVLTSLIVGPGHTWNGTNAQQGHLHRVREVTPGLWEGIAVWTSIVFGADYSFLHHSSVRFDGTTLNQSDAGGVGFGTTDAALLDHQLTVRAFTRVNVFVWANDFYVLAPNLLTNYQVGDLVAIAGLADGTFNEASIAVAATGANVVRVIEPTTTGAVAYTPANTLGTITPVGVDAMKRWAPFWLSTRVIGGTAASVTVEAKRWRPDEREPDWADPRTQRDTLLPNAGVPAVAVGPGRCGLWAAHMSANAAVSWGTVRTDRIT